MEDPFVSVILPIRNEARHITRCLDGVLTQDYAHDRMEILVVDGMSVDGTREIVTRIAVQDPRVRLVDNPERFVPTALNHGIQLARGTVIVRVDGHTVIAQDYVRRCVSELIRTGADNVGGPMRAVGNGILGRAIALATSSRFGVGNARFHYADKPGWVDTVYLGAYRREVFDRIGFFDEELIRNQDDEFNLRLFRTGGKIWLDPEIRSTYYARSSIRSLWKQYFEYGFWKVRVIQKHGQPASWRHLVPGAFVVALFASVALGLLFKSALLLLAVVSLYGFVALAVSFWLAVRKGLGYLPLLPLAFATMHLAYGFGFLNGLARFGFHRPIRSLPPRQETAKPVLVQDRLSPESSEKT